MIIQILNSLLILTMCYNLVIWIYSILFLDSKAKNFYLETQNILPINLGFLALSLYYLGITFMLLPVWLTAIRLTLKNFSQFKMSQFTSVSKEDKLTEFGLKYPTQFFALLFSDTIVLSILGFLLLLLQTYYIAIGNENSLNIFTKEMVYRETFFLLVLMCILIILSNFYEYFLEETPKEDINILLDFFRSIFGLYLLIFYFFTKAIEVFLDAFENFFFVLCWFLVSGMLINTCIQSNSTLIIFYVLGYILGIHFSAKRLAQYLKSLETNPKLKVLFVLSNSKKPTKTFMQTTLKLLTEPGNSGGNQALRTGTAMVTGVFGGAAYYNSQQRYLNDARILESYTDTVNTYAAASKNSNSGLHEIAKTELRSFAGRMYRFRHYFVPLSQNWFLL